MSSSVQKRVDNLITWVKSDHDLSISYILDVGAGTGRHGLYDLRGKCKKMIGIDMCQEVLQNPLLDEAHVESAYQTHFSDDYFDVIISIMVVEHLKDPLSFLKEMHRILKSGGSLYFITPNAYHYFTFISRLIPENISVKYLSWRDKQHKSTREHFETYYKLNNKMAVKKYSKLTDFNQYFIKYHESDDVAFYFPKPLKCLPRFYSTMVNKFQILNNFKVCMLVKLSKD